MLGAIIGDLISSRFDDFRDFSTDKKLISDECRTSVLTDLTIAAADAVIAAGRPDSPEEYRSLLSDNFNTRLSAIDRVRRRDCREIGLRKIVDIFAVSAHALDLSAAFSVVGEIAASVADARSFAYALCASTQGGAADFTALLASCVFLARSGTPDETLKEYVGRHALNNGMPAFTVSKAIDLVCASDSFENALKSALSVNGFKSALIPTTAVISEARFGVPNEVADAVYTFLDEGQRDVCRRWDELICGELRTDETCEETVGYFSVAVGDSERSLYYLCSIGDVNVGDEVLVPCGFYDSERVGRVVKIDDFPVSRLPVPLDRMKRIIAKIPPRDR